MKEDFKLNLEGTTLTVIMSYALASKNASAFQEKLNTFSGQDIRKIVFDATELVYISSAGIRDIIYARQRLGENPEIVFLNCAQEIQETFNMVGLTNFVHFTEDERKADYNSITNEWQKDLVESKKRMLDYFAGNNDVVCYHMKLEEGEQTSLNPDGNNKDPER